MNHIEGASWEKITPNQAQRLLVQTNTNNRKLRSSVVSCYAQDMKNGNWRKNPQPIIFYEDGSLADGQHRLHAVIESGKTISFMVARGVPKDVALNIDTGLTRSLTDSARIAGWDRPISSNIVAAALWVENGERQGSRRLSNDDRLAMVTRHEKHLVWAEQHRPRKPKVGNAMVSAALARAHMHERDLDRLASFCRILGGDIPTDPQADAAAHTLRNFLLVFNNARDDSRETFLKVQNAIRYFMRKKPLLVIKVVKDEAYPLVKKS